jgi:hypothetical protein
MFWSARAAVVETEGAWSSVTRRCGLGEITPYHRVRQHENGKGANLFRRPKNRPISHNWLRHGSPILQGKPSLPSRWRRENHPGRPSNLACLVLAAHLCPRDVVAPSAATRAVAAHVISTLGLRARASGGANGGSPRCARMATTTSLSEMSATIARLPPHRHAKTSTQSMRRRSSAHAIRERPGFTTPSPRLVRGRLRAAAPPVGPLARHPLGRWRRLRGNGRFQRHECFHRSRRGGLERRRRHRPEHQRLDCSGDQRRVDELQRVHRTGGTPPVRYCPRGCRTAADCKYDSGAADTDNFACTDGGCVYLGCATDAECAISSKTSLICGD